MIGALVAAAAPFPEWHPHLDTWAVLGAIELVYLIAVRRARTRRATVTSRRQIALFSTGVAVLWLASDWPVHDVAEGYLYSVHMVQHLLFTLVAALLLLLGTPAWMGRRLLGITGPAGPGGEATKEAVTGSIGPGGEATREAVTGPGEAPTRRLLWVRRLSRPVFGLIQFNLVLVLSHWPAVVEGTVRYHPLHFVAHAVLLVSAILMWMPVASTVPEVPRARPPIQMLYLFLQTVVPTVPASFLTFGDSPLYKIYATFPRLWDISALTDQQTAGLIMKIGAGLFLWTIIAVIFFRWYREEEGFEAPRSGRHPPPASTDDDVLLWADVERELRQLDVPDR